MQLSKEYMDILKDMALQIPAADQQTTYAELLAVAKGDGSIEEKAEAISKAMGKPLTTEQVQVLGMVDLLNKEDREAVVATAIGEMVAAHADQPIGNIMSTIFGYLTFWTKYL
jgi:hypothetical protein